MKNDTLLYALGSAIRRLRDHKDYCLIKTIYQGLKEDGFDITKVGGSEAEQYLRMWLTYSFTAAISNSKDEDIKSFANEVLNEIRGNREYIEASFETFEQGEF